MCSLFTSQQIKRPGEVWSNIANGLEFLLWHFLMKKTMIRVQKWPRERMRNALVTIAIIKSQRQYQTWQLSVSLANHVRFYSMISLRVNIDFISVAQFTAVWKVSIYLCLLGRDLSSSSTQRGSRSVRVYSPGVSLNIFLHWSVSFNHN